MQMPEWEIVTAARDFDPEGTLRYAVSFSRTRNTCQNLLRGKVALTYLNDGRGVPKALFYTCHLPTTVRIR